MTETLEPAEQKKRGFVLRYRLWMLFLLFIPAAFYAQSIGDGGKLVYTESKSVFWETGFQEILFSDPLPNGVVPAKGLNVDDAYQSLGVSFSYGTPGRLVKLKDSAGPLTKPLIRTEPGIVGPTNEPKQEQELGLQPADAASLSPSKHLNPGNGSFIGISGYAFKFAPDASFKASIASYQNLGTLMKRFQGPITIRFHKPDSPDVDAGVHHVGFFAARLNTPETLQVRLYTPQGRLIGFQSNLSDKCVFMGFESKYPIGWIEIEAVGSDKDYAIGNLIFDKVR